MTVTRNTVAKGAGAVAIKRISDNRLLYLNTNSKYTISKSTSDGDKVQGFNSDGKLVDLDIAGQDETYELEIASKKNTRNINEMVLNSAYVTKASYNAPWAESQTVASGTVTLTGGTPVATTLQASYLDGTKLTSTGTTPSAAGTYKDNADGTVTFHAGDNGKTIVFYYLTSVSNVFTQGGVDNDALGYLEVMFHQVSGTSSVTNKKSVDIFWLPKCSLSGESTLEFDNNVQDKTFKLTALIPDTPTGFKVPYAIIRDAEINNSNAG
jgi:hypothetical protein